MSEWHNNFCFQQYTRTWLIYPTNFGPWLDAHLFELAPSTTITQNENIIHCIIHAYLDF